MEEKTCDHKPAYNVEFDANYCQECGIWLEPKCTDANCEFCRPRPVMAPIQRIEPSKA